MRTALFLALLCGSIARGDTLRELLQRADAAFGKGDRDAALKLADEAVKAYPDQAAAYLLRSKVREAVRQNAEALADLDTVLKLDPTRVEAVNRRGAVEFKLGRIKESIADFDSYLARRPDEAPGHWMRGISLYYAARYEDGRKQFEVYEKVDTNDVENAVWHYLCNVRVAGRDKARAQMLKIGNDRRVPMMLVYKLFKGEVKPEEVLAASEADKVPDEQRQQRRFYAHLYVGLYYESEGDKKPALEHLKQAATTYRIGHYMGDVAKVHADLLEK
jgi:lipoprotein NlpI